MILFGLDILFIILGNRLLFFEGWNKNYLCLLGRYYKNLGGSKWTMFNDIRRTRIHGNYFDVLTIQMCCSPSSDGNIIVYGYKDNTLRVWDATSFHCIQELNGHSETVRSPLLYSSCSRVTTFVYSTIRLDAAQYHQILI